MAKVLIETDNEQILEDVNVDGRGRVTLGRSEFKDIETVSLAITEINGEPAWEYEKDGD